MYYQEEEQFNFSEKRLGYYGRVYKEEFICNMEEVMKTRARNKEKYSDEQMLFFLQNALLALEDLQKHGYVHSCLTPFNFVLTEKSERTFKLIGVGSLFHFD